MTWPWVSRRAYDEVLRQNRGLQQRLDRLIEAVSRPEANAPVVMPTETPVELELGEGWWDTKKPV
jgi:hypothetical protein